MTCGFKCTNSGVVLCGCLLGRSHGHLSKTKPIDSLIRMITADQYISLGCDITRRTIAIYDAGPHVLFPLD